MAKKPEPVLLSELPDEEVKRIMGWTDVEVAEFRAVMRGEDPHVRIETAAPRGAEKGRAT